MRTSTKNSLHALPTASTLDAPPPLVNPRRRQRKPMETTSSADCKPSELESMVRTSIPLLCLDHHRERDKTRDITTQPFPQAARNTTLGQQPQRRVYQAMFKPRCLLQRSPQSLSALASRLQHPQCVQTRFPLNQASHRPDDPTHRQMIGCLQRLLISRTALPFEPSSFLPLCERRSSASHTRIPRPIWKRVGSWLGH